MRTVNPLHFTTWVLLAGALVPDHTFLLPVYAKSRPSSGSRPSSNSSPSSPSSPRSPTASSPTASSPTSFSRPAVKTPNGPISSTTRSAYNPSPSFKPLSSAGAPTVRSGGGGYGSTAKKIAGAVVGGVLVYAAVNVAAGYFLYGGRHSSPYCRGDDVDRFQSGRCPRGQSSQAHDCKSSIPLCPIPELVRGKWNFGSDALPKVDVRFDKSVCSVEALPATTTTTPAASAPSNSTLVSAPSNSTSAPTSAPSPSPVASAADGVEGDSGLDTCLRRIVAAGGCGSYGTGSLFQFDENSGTCGCCSSVQVTTLDDDSFQSAVYSHRAADDLGGVAPNFCISGSTMYYPDTAGGADAAHACECGACTTCGGGGPRYMDWSGPYVVPDAVGDVAFVDAAKTQPLYDPVDTCLCDDTSLSQCETDALESSPAATVAGGAYSSNLVVALSALVFLLHSVRRD